jgi:hypothetical protein
MPETTERRTTTYGNIPLDMSPAELERRRAQEIARRDQFAGLYPQIAASIDRAVIANLPSDVNAREVIIPTVGRNEEEDEKLAEVRKVHRRMAESTIIPATVINLAPWPVQGQGAHLMYPNRRIPACPIGQAFERFVFVSYDIDLEDKGGRFGADAITPIALANDLVGQLRPQKRGGLFHYMGDHLPGENPKTKEEELKVWDKAKAEMVRYMKQKYREAEGFYQQPARKGLSNIVEEHRLSCQWLLHYRFLTGIPAWLTATREEGDVPDACPGCGQEPGAGFACGNCGYIMNPLSAYQLGEIDDDHHSLRRLTREQLDELGLDYVMTKDEYREERRKQVAESGHKVAPRRKEAARPAGKKAEPKDDKDAE